MVNRFNPSANRPALPATTSSRQKRGETSVWYNLLKRRGCSVVKLFPREVPRVLNLLPREQIENSRNFPREQFHHTAPEAFQQIVILTKSLQWTNEQNENPICQYQP